RVEVSTGEAKVVAAWPDGMTECSNLRVEAPGVAIVACQTPEAAPDGFDEYGNSQLWRVPLDGSGPTRLVDVPEDVGYWTAWDVAGTTLVEIAGQDSAAVHVIRDGALHELAGQLSVWNQVVGV